MTTFHNTTVTILKHVLAEQDRDLTLFQHRLERADEGATPFAVQSFRNQIAELTAVAGDFRRLVTLVQAANAAAAAGLPAEIVLDARTKAPEPERVDFDQPDADPTTEAFVDVADAERYAQRDEYVNASNFAASDLVNVSDPSHKHFGVRGSIVGFVYDPDGVVVEYDNLGNTLTVAASQLMHYADFVAQPQEYFDAAEAEDVRQIEREMAIEAGDDSEIDRQVAEDDVRNERNYEAHEANEAWLDAHPDDYDAETEAAQEAWAEQHEAAVDEALAARDAESEA